jgi:hypothetical protein
LRRCVEQRRTGTGAHVARIHVSGRVSWRRVAVGEGRREVPCWSVHVRR